MAFRDEKQPAVVLGHVGDAVERAGDAAVQALDRVAGGVEPGLIREIVVAGHDGRMLAPA